MKPFFFQKMNKYVALYNWLLEYPESLLLLLLLLYIY